MEAIEKYRFRTDLTGTITSAECLSLPEMPMTESQKLSVLRDKLIRRRRALVEAFRLLLQVDLDGDDLVRVQNEIEAVERAMAEEKRAEFASDRSPSAIQCDEQEASNELLTTTQKARE